MKKISFYLLIGYFLLQLVFPGYFIYRHYNTLYTGESYKFAVEPYDPYDPFRGRYVALQPVFAVDDSEGRYAVLDKDGEGYAIITGWQEQRPVQGQFAKDLQLNRYYMNEKMAPAAERIQLNPAADQESFYLLVMVKNGDYVIQGLYINDIPIEEYIAQG